MDVVCDSLVDDDLIDFIFSHYAIFEYCVINVVMFKSGGMIGFQRDVRSFTPVHCRVEAQYSAGEQTFMAR